MTWRRVADWKQTITLVELLDLPISRLVTPEAQLRDRFPRLAALVAETKLARVEPALAKRLQAAGATTYDVGYHRGSDGLMFAEVVRGQRSERQVDVNALDLGDLSGDTDDEADDLADDRVDALLRIFSEGRITERAVILAFHAPPATDAPAPLDEAALSAIDALAPAALPAVSEPFVARVAAALAVVKPPQLGPALPPERRRSYIRQAGVVGAIAGVAGIGGSLWAPVVGVLAAPVVVLCGAVIALHAVALRQDASRPSTRSS